MNDDRTKFCSLDSAGIKQLCAEFEYELKYFPRFVFATNPSNGDKYRFRLHQTKQAGQLRMVSELSKRGLVTRCWGGDLRPEWVSNPTGVLHPDPVISVPNRWLCLLQGLLEVLVDLWQTCCDGKR